MKILLLMVCLALPLPALAQHSATVTWAASPDAAANPTLAYNVYRAAGACPTTGEPATFAKLTSTLAGILSYTDSSVSAATSYCYWVRSTLNGKESADSSLVTATIPLAPAANVSVSSQ